jgi:hypothetical protein
LDPRLQRIWKLESRVLVWPPELTVSISFKSFPLALWGTVRLTVALPSAYRVLTGACLPCTVACAFTLACASAVPSSLRVTGDRDAEALAGHRMGGDGVHRAQRRLDHDRREVERVAEGAGVWCEVDAGLSRACVHARDRHREREARRVAQVGVLI